MKPVVLKFGGELLEDPQRVTALAATIAKLTKKKPLVPLVIVHGGGREIDASLARAGIQKRQVDGLRITDEPTLDIVVSVLAGLVNTRFVAALGAAGVQAVGLTGADASVARVTAAPPHKSTGGATIDLGRVGEPIGRERPSLLIDLCRKGYVPVVSSIGASRDGELFNVNADTLASHLAARLKSPRLIIAGATAGVLERDGSTIADMTFADVDALIGSGGATAGMVAKLAACRSALDNGAREVFVADGKDLPGLAVLARHGRAAGAGKSTRITKKGVLMQSVRDLESKYIVQTYRRTPIVLVRGKGVRVYDAEGREYLDLLAGIGVSALGHGHEGLAAAIAEQAREMMHCSNLFFHPLQGQVAERLATLSGLSRAFFCNSGAEAVETCLKFARRYWHTSGNLDRTGIIAMEGDFHGRTMGALSATWHYRAPFEPLVPNVRFVPMNAAAVRDAVTDKTAAIILEPIQGEGGVRPLPQDVADAVTEVCRRTGTLLIADEVQCGLGRTGQAFYFQKLGLNPDLVSIGKALAGGVPMGAALLKEEVAAAIAFGDHGTTFGGNLLACRAALVCLDQLTGGLMDHVKRTGAHLESKLREMQKKYPAIVDVRGAGLMWGLELNTDAAPVHEAAIRQGVLVNRTAETVIRLLPPLIITEAELDRALGLLDAAFSEVFAGVTT